MEIREERVRRTKNITRLNEEARRSAELVLTRQGSAGSLRALESSNDGGPDGDDASAPGSRALNGVGKLRPHDELLFVHRMLIEVVHGDGAERADADVKRHERHFDVSRGEAREGLLRDVESRAVGAAMDPEWRANTV